MLLDTGLVALVQLCVADEREKVTYTFQQNEIKRIVKKILEKRAFTFQGRVRPLGVIKYCKRAINYLKKHLESIAGLFAQLENLRRIAVSVDVLDVDQEDAIKSK